MVHNSLQTYRFDPVVERQAVLPERMDVEGKSLQHLYSAHPLQAQCMV
jgi:hypothetical protein